MPLPWRSFMQQSPRFREIRSFMDQISDSPLPFGALRGIPNSPVVSTTRAPITGFPTEVEGRGFAGMLDGTAGTIEVPETGEYQISGTLGGQMAGHTSNAEIVLFVRPSGRADLGPVTAYSLDANRSSFVGLPFFLFDHLTKGEIMSLQIDANANFNQTFFITYASFEIARRSEL